MRRADIVILAVLNTTAEILVKVTHGVRCLMSVSVIIGKIVMIIRRRQTAYVCSSNKYDIYAL